VVVLVAGFLFANRGVLAAPFGFSFDGQNAGQFGLQIRAMEQHGLVESRVGGRYAASGHGSLDTTYAHHPPLIYVEGYLTRLVAGDGNAATRAPAWIGSLASIALLAWLLLDTGVDPPAAAVGLLLGLGSSMFFVYGSMLDTFVTSLPFGIAAAIAAQRTVQERPPPRWVSALLGVLAALAGWQALLVAVGGTAWIVLRRRRVAGGWRDALPLGAGAVAGACAVAAWIMSVDGSLGGLLSQGGHRSGGVSLGDWFHFQVAALQDLFNPVVLVLGPVLLVLAWIDRRTRDLLVLLLLVVVVYTAAFREGSSIHGYWNYWLVLPVSVAAAAACNAVLARHDDGVRRLALGFVALLAVWCVITPTFFDRSTSRAVRVRGETAPALIERAEQMIGSPPTIAVEAPPDDREAWIPYLIGTKVVTCEGRAALDQEAAAHPGLLVLTTLPSSGTRRDELVHRALVHSGDFALLPATSMPGFWRTGRWPLRVR
jgi:hypothetical protein